MEILLILIVLLIVSIIGIVKGFMRRVIATFWTFVFVLLVAYSYVNKIHSPVQFVQHVYHKYQQYKPDTDIGTAPTTGHVETPAIETNPVEQVQVNLPEHFVERLTGTEVSSTTEGSVKHGATILLGDLEDGKATWGHILVSDSQEPGQNGEKRQSLNYNPRGWRNFKLKNKAYSFDRAHLIGYQFSGLNDEARNLITGTAYLNRGTEGRGSQENNPDSMLFYEQRLDSWLATHPNFKLDYYVKAIYRPGEVTPSAVYMQWVGVDDHGQTIEINIGGHSSNTYEHYSSVIVNNQSPSYAIDYVSDPVQIKEK